MRMEQPFSTVMPHLPSQEGWGHVWHRSPVQSLMHRQSPPEHVPPCWHVTSSQGSGASHIPFTHLPPEGGLHEPLFLGV
jgi:hypothetical protein